MTISTYSDLQTEIASFTSRQDLGTEVTTFIQFLEADAQRNLRVREMITRASPSTSSGAITLPADCLAIHTLKTVPGTSANFQMEYVGPDEFEDINSALITGTPTRYYTIYGFYCPMLPAPADGTVLNLVYWQNIPPLSNTNTTNWLLSKSPDLYLKGALCEAAAFGFEDERIPLWQSQVNDRYQQMNLEGERALRPATKLVAARRGF